MASSLSEKMQVKGRTCSEVTRLRRWALRAPRVCDVEFARLVTGGGSSRSLRPGKASRER
ncbi:MAG TPA: hypothetical protein VE359_04035 [Vicinamibacteria bacterium]|nr:hypothetical protein [Vicinamibacteria bacterium]